MCFSLFFFHFHLLHSPTSEPLLGCNGTFTLKARLKLSYLLCVLYRGCLNPCAPFFSPSYLWPVIRVLFCVSEHFISKKISLWMSRTFLPVPIRWALRRQVKSNMLRCSRIWWWNTLMHILACWPWAQSTPVCCENWCVLQSAMCGEKHILGIFVFRIYNLKDLNCRTDRTLILIGCWLHS